MSEAAAVRIDDGRDPFAPVHDELDLADLRVEGRLPADLVGRYLRTGPNPWHAAAVDPASAFPTGDGMVHALAFEGGTVRYRNRFVVTPHLQAARAGQRDPGGRRNPANHSLVRHAGRLLALGATGLPTELSAGLSTVGETDFDGALPGSLGAHPKADPVWEELLWLRASSEPPFLVHGVVSPRGRVSRTVAIDVPRPVLVHDLVATDQHIVFLAAPAVLVDGQVEWQAEHETRFGVLPREGDADDVRWFPVDARFVWHFVNGWTDGHEITVDHVAHATPTSVGPRGQGPVLRRSVLDLASGRVRDEVLDTRPVEMPRVDPRRAGLRHRVAYAGIARHGVWPSLGAFDGLVRYDLQADVVVEHTFPEGVLASEPIVAPRAGSLDEDDAWVLTTTFDTRRATSAVVVLDPHDFAGPPVATVELGVRVPVGAHGLWVAADE